MLLGKIRAIALRELVLTRQLVIKDLVDGHKWARNVTSNFTSTLTSGLRLIKLVKFEKLRLISIGWLAKRSKS